MNKVGIVKLFAAADAIAASGTSTSAAIELSKIRIAGFFSFYILLAGDGTAKVEYELSFDESVWVTPTSASDIVTSHIKTSGTSGRNVYAFEPELAPFLRIKITETSTTDAVYVRGFLAVT